MEVVAIISNGAHGGHRFGQHRHAQLLACAGNAGICTRGMKVAQMHFILVFIHSFIHYTPSKPQIRCNHILVWLK